MSRKDGLPTNAEILADFRCASRQVFVQAYDRQFSGEKLHPGFEDKPLSSLYLTVGDTGQEPQLGRVSVLAELLSIQSIDKRIGPMIEAHPTLSQLPPDVKDRYRKLGADTTEIALTKGLSIASVLPMEAVNANYYAHLSDGKEVNIGVFEKRQTKMNLIAAKYFANEALVYVRSDDFDDPDSEFIHDFGLEISVDLPLNGHEPLQFLIEFRRRMVNEYNRWYQTSLVQVPDPEIQMTVNQIKAYVSKCAKAAEQAQVFIDRRND